MNTPPSVGPTHSESEATPPSLRSDVRHGGLWIGSSIAIQAGIGGIAQVLLGRWLTPFDFGLFALYVSSSFVFGVLAVGGIRTALTQRAASELHDLAPPAFKTSIVLAVGSATVLATLSPMFAALFDEPALVPIILVGAIALPLRSYASVAIPALQARLEFRTVAVAVMLGGASHYAVALTLASMGWGAMSLVVGSVTGAAVLSLSLLPATKSIMRGHRQSVAGWADIVRMSRWPLLGDIATDSSTRVDYFILGLFAPTSVVGGYYFAYQLVARAGELLLGVSRNVLFPVLAQIQSDDARQIRGLYRAASALVVATGIGAALLIATMPGVERLVWGGKWTFAVFAMAVLATALPLQIAVTVSEQLLKARGLFRQWTALLVLRATGVAITALAVGIIAGDSVTTTIIAIALAAYLVGEALIEMAVLSRLLSFSLTRYWKIVLPLWAWFAGLGWLGALIAGGFNAGPIFSIAIGGSVVAAGSGVILGIGHRTGRLRLRLT